MFGFRYKNWEEYLEREKEILVTSTVAKNGPAWRKGRGHWFEDSLTGEPVFDNTSGVGTVPVGHNHPMIVSAVRNQLLESMTGITADWPILNMWENPETDEANEISRVAIAEKLIDAAKNCMPFRTRVGFSAPSGAEAVNALGKVLKRGYLETVVNPRRMEAGKSSWGMDYLRACQKSEIFSPTNCEPFRFGFLAFERAFHGRIGLAQLLSSSKPQHLVGVSSSDVVGRLPFPVPGTDLSELKKLADQLIEQIEHRHCVPVIAFFFEPIQGEGGIRVPDPEVLRGLIAHLRNRGLYIVSDEIQTGFGRMGHVFGCDAFDIVPDAMVFAKSVAAGVPFGAYIINTEIIPDLNEGIHSGTNHCPPLGCAAAIAAQGIFPKLIPTVAAAGPLLLGDLRDIGTKFSGKIKEVRGVGYMLGIEFFDAKIRDQVIFNALEFPNPKGQRCLLAPAGENVVRYYPILNATLDELDIGLEFFYDAVKKV